MELFLTWENMFLYFLCFLDNENCKPIGKVVKNMYFIRHEKYNINSDGKIASKKCVFINNYEEYAIIQVYQQQ